MVNLEEIYRERARQYQAEASALQQRYNRLALARLIVFVAGVLALVYLWGWHWLAGALVTLLFLGAFYRFIQRHQRIQEESRHLERLGRINGYEREALERLFIESKPWSDGAGFVDPDHPYSLDLDLFGPYSFFLYVNRCGTSLGRQRLAAYLQAGAAPAEIEARQAAVAELGGQLDWRQHLQAYGLETKDEPQHIELLRRWLDDEVFVSNDRRLRAALYLTPLWVAAGLLIWALYLPWYLGILFLAPPALILRRTLDRVNYTHQRTTHAGNALSDYARLISHIERGNFTSPKLKELQGALVAGERRASTDIARLSYIISQLNVRYNAFAIFLNLFALWDLQWVYRLEQWKAAHRRSLPAWFEALAEIEALNSLSSMFGNNPDWTFPVIREAASLSGEALGHPLIHPAKRVTNDLQMPTSGHIKLITGSNMAGKSTFLRTVGLNVVLAMAGAPVCARRLELPLLQVYTSMRTQDALHESTSSFYAELKRLQFIIEAVERGDNVFFLLDEILKGTNSRDRHTGSKALIRQLIKSGGGGLIATHDLELGALESLYGGAIENLCMEVAIRDGELFFDYKLGKGVSRSFNATLLMKNMGIRIEE